MSTADHPEQLLQNLRALVTEAEKVLTAGGEPTEPHLQRIRERLDEARHKAEEVLTAARQKVVEGAKQADATIRAHPYESIAVALGVGVLIGVLLRRRN